MNILWLSHLVPYPPKGGVMQRSYNLMKEISKYHKLHIICFTQKSLQPTKKARTTAIEGLSNIGEITDVFEFDSDKSQLSNIVLAAKSLFTMSPYTVNWLKKNGVSESIQSVINKHNIDLVHFDTISWASYIDDVTGCKLVLNHHNIESHMMLRRAKQEINILKKLYFYQEGWKLKKYEKRYCKRFDLNITCSKIDSQRLLEDTPELFIEDIPNGVDLEYFHPQGLKQVPHSIIFAGGMSWYPNVAAMKFFTLEVLPSLIKKIPDVQLNIIGRNPPQWLKELGNKSNNVTVTGFVDDVRPYLEQASVYICPINDGGGTKLKILDALAMGKAIVAHHIACEGIDVIEDENVCFAETPEDFEKKIIHLFNNDALRIKLGNKGSQLIKKQYSFESIGQKMNELYSDLIE